MTTEHVKKRVATYLRFRGGTLTLEGLTRPAVERVFPSTPWVWDPRVSAWRTDALHYRTVVSELPRLAARVVDQVPGWRSIAWSTLRLRTLRPEQRDAVEAWHHAGRRGCVVMPTGTGKTEVALAMMAQTRVSTLVVAPVRDLMYQWHRRILNGLGVNAGVIGDRVFRVSPVSVTTYDSACIYMPRLGNRFQLVIFDECHHLPGPVRRDAARMCAAPWRLGLTATPERADGRHQDLPRLIGPVVYELTISAVRGTTLADYEVVRIPVQLSPSERERYARLSRQVQRFMYRRRQADPDFGWEDVCWQARRDPDARRAMSAYRAKKAIEDRAEDKLRVLEDLFRLHAGEPCLVFAGSNAMAREVSRRFLIPCLLSHCGKQERYEILEGLEHGTYPALVANRVLDEGVDLPEVKVAVVIGGSASGRQAKQRLGRILRKRGGLRATLYEVVTAGTGEVNRSRRRRDSDAYQRTHHRRV